MWCSVHCTYLTVMFNQIHFNPDKSQAALGWSQLVPTGAVYSAGKTQRMGYKYRQAGVNPEARPLEHREMKARQLLPHQKRPEDTPVTLQAQAPLVIHLAVAKV